MNDILEWKVDKINLQLYLPKIDEMHKSILLGNWKDKIRLVKKLLTHTR